MSSQAKDIESLINRLDLLIASHQVALQEAITIRSALAGLNSPASRNASKGIDANELARVKAGMYSRRNIPIKS